MIHTDTTPSGLAISFEDGLPDESGKSKKRKYEVNGVEVPSVTTALGCLEKGGLPFAAEKIAIEGCIQLARTEGLPEQVDGVLTRLKSEELRFYQEWRKKGDRGTQTHDELGRLVAGEAEVTDLSQGALPFAYALRNWYAEEGPETIASELMVASVVHGFAGRFDLLTVLPKQHPNAKVRLDLKTSAALPKYANGSVKPPYPEHLAQLAGYEIAAVESGYGASDYQGILRVDEQGEVDLFLTVVDPGFFLRILDCYRALQGLKKVSRLEPQQELAA